MADDFGFRLDIEGDKAFKEVLHIQNITKFIIYDKSS
jgi:hypothetical protein